MFVWPNCHTRKIPAAIVLFSPTRILCILSVRPHLRRAINIWSPQSQVLDVGAFEPAFQRAGTDLRGTSLARLNRTSSSLQTRKSRGERTMRRALAVITTVGALAVGGSAYASQATGTSAPQNRKPAAQTAQVTGTLTNFDSASNTLTLSTLNGEQTFVIGSTTMLHQGRKVITTSDLANLAGHNVTVRYAESAGEKFVETVDISRRGATPKPAATSGTAKKQPAGTVAEKSGGQK